MKWMKSGLLSDPQIKYKRTKHRMTNSEFCNCIKSTQKDGVVNLKTDSEFMHGYTLGLLHGGHEVCMRITTYM
jgi:tRNA (guanine-N7-)-methyltransferase